MKKTIDLSDLNLDPVIRDLCIIISYLSLVADEIARYEEIAELATKLGYKLTSHNMVRRWEFICSMYFVIMNSGSDIFNGAQIEVKTPKGKIHKVKNVRELVDYLLGLRGAKQFKLGHNIILGYRNEVFEHFKRKDQSLVRVECETKEIDGEMKFKAQSIINPNISYLPLREDVELCKGAVNYLHETFSLELYARLR